MQRDEILHGSSMKTTSKMKRNSKMKMTSKLKTTSNMKTTVKMKMTKKIKETKIKTIPGPSLHNHSCACLLKTLKSEISDLTLDCVRHLDFRSEDLLVLTYLTAATLSQLLNYRFRARPIICIIGIGIGISVFFRKSVSV